MICTIQLIHNIQFSYIHWRIRSVLFFFLSREEDLGSFFFRSHVFILLLYLALSVIIETVIWHEFVLYEEFVLHEIAEQLNKLHSAFGAFSQTLRIASGISHLATALKAVRDVHDFPVFRTSQSSPFFCSSVFLRRFACRQIFRTYSRQVQLTYCTWVYRA